MLNKKNDKTKWQSASVLKEQAERIDKLVSEGKISSRNAFITEAIRELLEEYAPRFEHYNTYDDRTSIKDRMLGKKGEDIEVFLREDCLQCEICESTKCEHVIYALSLPQVKDVYQKKGLKIPDVE